MGIQGEAMGPAEALRQFKRARQAYEKRVRAILGACAQDDREARTQSGLPLKLLYTPLDVQGRDYLRDLGFPGDYPYTRGVFPAGHRAQEWPSATSRTWRASVMPEYGRLKHAVLTQGR
ncbi:MAG: methylmalonyl-CoA mutase family protein [Candidatus Methylomirabilales bacterium]